ncbi:MAG: hypothetical protein M5U12_19475 [Verrucomicrobia bacterium]|nr:hypothetical protein [Verrucomicrobiota bacterium]
MQLVIRGVAGGQGRPPALPAEPPVGTLHPMISMAGLWGIGLVLGWLTHRLCEIGLRSWRRVLALGWWLAFALAGVWAMEGPGTVTMALAGMAGAGWRGAVLEWVKRLERKGIQE